MRKEVREILNNVIHQRNGGFTPQDAEKAGISKRTIYNLRDSGEIIPISRGVFQFADTDRFSPEYAAVKNRLPHGVVCLVSALYHHNLTTEIPQKIDIAIERNRPVPKISYPPVKIYRFSPKAFNAGIVQMEIGGVMLNIYSPEKTIADCFKYRNKLGTDIAIEALKNYLERSADINLTEFFKMAKICRVANVIKPYVDSLL